MKQIFSQLPFRTPKPQYAQRTGIGMTGRWGGFGGYWTCRFK